VNPDVPLAAAFWLSALLLAYTFGGYAILMELLARLRPKPLSASPDSPVPSVCVVLVACNEEARIAARLENLLASDYPPEKLRVLVISDGSTDATAARVRAFGSPRVEVIEQPHRSGKAAGLTAGVAHCSAEIVVFADARQRFASDTISRLAAHFSDPVVGAVSGALEIDRAASAVGSGVDAYWKMEKRIRAAEARFDSCIGCTGAVYAIRRELFEPLPPDTILDDVVIPMGIVLRGFRVLHDPTALAFDAQPLEPATETVRKRRTLAGNYQMLFRHPAWLLPSRNRLWLQLISHKYLRILAPAFLLTALAASLALSRHPLYRAAFLAQCAFYALAAIGILAPRLRSRLFSLPAGFTFLNLATVRAFAHYLRGNDLHRWERTRHS
jgi:cellulose synthase/poly-beta-1,6-N-acetylglucosamine synthase-like glycosyltransferase